MMHSPVPTQTTDVLSVTGLQKTFGGKQGLFGSSKPLVQAVSGIDLNVRPGEILGIVGESGCGKSTTARLLVRLIEPDAGTVRINGQEIDSRDPESIRALRRNVQMVFQDSYASLNPRMTIGETVAFGPRIQGTPAAKAQSIARDILARVGLDPNRFAGRYPHELSGGQRQRVNIARALAYSPKVVILDEAVSALDKSVEAQVVNLLCDLRQELNLSYIFISHDLNVVQYISDRVMVMYLGQVAEVGNIEDVYDNPGHPYTKALLSAVPSMDPSRRTKTAPIAGDPPNPINPPSGCRFRTRCPFAEPVCAQKKPDLTEVRNKFSHLAACHMLNPSSGHSLAGVRNV